MELIYLLIISFIFIRIIFILVDSDFSRETKDSKYLNLNEVDDLKNDLDYYNYENVLVIKETEELLLKELIDDTIKFDQKLMKEDSVLKKLDKDEAVVFKEKRDAIDKLEYLMKTEDYWFEEEKDYIEEYYLLGIGNVSNQSNYLKTNEINQVLNSKKITGLLHFTNMNNLKNILDYGFLPRTNLYAKKIEVYINDLDRFDNKLEMTSFSIGFPNYKMFYYLRTNKKDVKWVVIEVDPELLYTHEEDVLYCKHNAASSKITEKKIEELKGSKSFEDMFSEVLETKYYGTIYRKTLNLPENYTTDPQAEVLISGIIDSRYIKKIHFESINDYNFAQKLVGNNLEKLVCDIEKSYFRPRKDYIYWKKKG